MLKVCCFFPHAGIRQIFNECETGDKSGGKGNKICLSSTDKCFLGFFSPSKQAGCLSFGIFTRLHMPGITEEKKQRHNLIHFPRTVQPALEVEKIGM